MRTSLNELWHIENQLYEAKNDLNKRTIWEAQLLADPKLNDKVNWQKKAYQIIRYFGRKELKKELDRVHNTLMTSPGKKPFRERVQKIFLT